MQSLVYDPAYSAARRLHYANLLEKHRKLWVNSAPGEDVPPTVSEMVRFMDHKDYLPKRGAKPRSKTTYRCFRRNVAKNMRKFVD